MCSLCLSSFTQCIFEIYWCSNMTSFYIVARNKIYVHAIIPSIFCVNQSPKCYFLSCFKFLVVIISEIVNILVAKYLLQMYLGQWIHTVQGFDYVFLICTHKTCVGTLSYQKQMRVLISRKLCLLEPSSTLCITMKFLFW